MKSSVIVLLIIVFNSFLSYGQNENSKENSKESVNDFNVTFTGSATLNSTGLWVPAYRKDNSIEGTPYLFKNSSGMYSVINTKGDKFKVLNLNYNIETKTIESQVGKDSVFQYTMTDIDYVLANNKRYKVVGDEMFLELYKGADFKLLKQFSIRINEGVTNPLSMADLSPRRYVIKEEYKLHKDNALSKFKLGKSSILKLFNDKNDAIVKYVKENNLSYSEESDVIRILNYISTI